MQSVSVNSSANLILHGLTLIAKPARVVVRARHGELRRLEEARNCSLGHF